DVREGEPLLKLDDRLAKLKLEQAKTAVQLAAIDVTRAEAARDGAQVRVRRLRGLLEETEVGFRKDLDEAQIQLRIAEAAVREAQLKVEQARAAEKQAQYGADLTVVRATTGVNSAAGASPGQRR